MTNSIGCYPTTAILFLPSLFAYVPCFCSVRPCAQGCWTLHGLTTVWPCPGHWPEEICQEHLKKIFLTTRRRGGNSAFPLFGDCLIWIWHWEPWQPFYAQGWLSGKVKIIRVLDDASELLDCPTQPVIVLASFGRVFCVTWQEACSLKYTIHWALFAEASVSTIYFVI